ncbi:Pentalenolactone D synthase [Cyphellophora attinorum]|uniref:Pentalenolactone D synthase n=1 Tax=Cyphellophora attinorum TaxID=1664694 RepID=A0A0N1P1I0_9EURO|nr:Pentalenolactone D synthase [Phialophora attinorum]KPI43830.1 Pentalenolactone D synthase [Phialophora attinorum]
MGSVDVDTTQHALEESTLHMIADRLKKYDGERDKRLRPDGLDQYVLLSKTEDPTLRAFTRDPWLNERSDKVTLHDGQTIEHLVLGAGMGGLAAGINFIKSGVNSDDVYLVDDAGGLGGSWYWNRYPRVSCDIESYVYFPYLEETGYMPKHNFSYGFEIRAYLESLAARYGLDKNAMYRTKVQSAVWDDSAKRWEVTMLKTISSGPPKTIKVRTRFLSFFPGVHVYQKLPAIPGISSYSGQQFHIARWDYSVTGGTEEEPVLDKLRDKRVAIIGNGCSGVQGIAEVAKYAKELYVMQRTPASVDIRDQRPTDPAEWAEISKDPNWWDIRCRNMADTLSGALKPGEPQLVDDYTVGVTTYRVVFGGKAEG